MSPHVVGHVSENAAKSVVLARVHESMNHSDTFCAKSQHTGFVRLFLSRQEKPELGSMYHCLTFAKMDYEIIRDCSSMERTPPGLTHIT
jgi:hypothetical protein